MVGRHSEAQITKRICSVLKKNKGESDERKMVGQWRGVGGGISRVSTSRFIYIFIYFALMILVT